ncbi:MAG: vancomycin resistance protein [Myxococcales bacterium]|nr:MAG: vancomycin resistance protein [Myxococcales bacterium]
MRVSGVALSSVLLSALLGAGAGLWPALERRLPEPTAVTLSGRTPPRDRALSTWLAQRAEREAETEIRVTHPDGALVAARSDLGVSLDTEAALGVLARPRATTSVLTRLRVWLGGAAPEPVDLPMTYRLDAARAASWLAQLAPALRLDPVDARLDLSGHERVEARSGRELDLGASLSKLAALGGADEVALVFTEVAPRVPTSALAEVDPSIVLSEYETDFAKRGGPRVKNIARAAQLLDGALLAPGEVWSFNRTVGPRTLERGFVDAPVIVADELEPGVGGGVCQVATTLFAAGVMGGLDVVKRRSHSRPSGYAPLGLDATVIDGEVDLQLRNPYRVPIIVHAFLPVPTRVRVEMLGAGAPGKVEHTYSVTKSEDFFRRVDRRPELLPDQVKRHQKGIPGYDVLSTVRTRFVDGSERVRHYASTYYPVPEIYWVGAAVDPAALPALPERATHMELQGEPVTPAGYSP